jgi:hypothetical protein
MAFSDDNGGMVMPVAPVGGYGNAFGSGDGSWWILLLFILLGGWGNGFGGYGNGGAGFVDNSVQRGFDQSAVMGAINGVGNNVVSGFGDTATNLCGGFAGVNAAISNGFAQAEIAANARQMADMNQMFALQSSLQNCCCENRAGIADLKYTIAQEACADRAAVTAGVQQVLDVICQDKIDNKNEKILELQNALNMANLAASQTAQTAEIISKLPAATTTA